LQRPAEPGRAGGLADAEHARGCLAVEVEYDAQRDHLAFPGGEARERPVELGAEAFERRVLVTVGDRSRLLAPPAPLLGAEPVEPDRAGAASSGIEAAPQPQRLLEGVTRQVLRERGVAAEVEQVAVDVVEVLLGHGREGRPRAESLLSGRVERHGVHALITPHVPPASHPRAGEARRSARPPGRAAAGVWALSHRVSGLRPSGFAALGPEVRGAAGFVA